MSIRAAAYHWHFASRPACLHACLKSAGETCALWVLRSGLLVDRVGMEPIGSHYAILLHDRQLRSTIVSDRESRPRDPRLALTRITNRAGALGARLRGALAEFRLVRIVRSPAD